MSDQVIIVLIIVVAIVIVLVVFRDKLSRFVLKTKYFGANLKTHRNKGINITKTRQKGKGHKISVGQDNVNINGLDQKGECNKLIVKKE